MDHRRDNTIWIIDGTDAPAVEEVEVQCVCVICRDNMCVIDGIIETGS